MWLGVNPLTDSGSGSLVDDLISAFLILSAVVVLCHRNRLANLVLKLSWPVALYFLYCLASAAWSDFPGHGLTRWVRGVGDLAMALVIATDPQPTAALRRFFSRVGFILLPVSILLLKYYPSLGHVYDLWGENTNTGVTTNKNMLGVMTFALTLGAFWQVLRLLRNKDEPNRKRRLLAQGFLLYFGLALLFTAHSATSGACFTLGAGLMIATSLPLFTRRPAAVHALVLAILLGGGLVVLLGGKGAAASAVGRNADFTGRTEVWELLFPMAPNPIVGAGFENFWFGPRLENLWRIYPGVNEAHDGYLEVYLNLGLVGVGMIFLILIQGYRRAVDAFRRNPALGSLLVAYILSSAIYSITEAGFRMLDPIWFCLILSSFAASRAIVMAEAPSQASPELAGPATHLANAGPNFVPIGTGRAAASVSRSNSFQNASTTHRLQRFS